VLDWAVIAPNPGDLGASAFGGTLPSGEVTIPAGQTGSQFTVDVPAGALGNQPSAILEVQITDPNNPIFASTAQTTIINGTPTAGTPAVAQLALLTNIGTFTQNGNDYTLNLGTVVQGEALPALQFALVNAASAPADSLSGTFSESGVGFAVSGSSLPTAVAAGQSYNGLQVTMETGVLGANQETITFNPEDTNASGYSASLPTLTLTITDTASAPAVATINTPTSITLPNVRVGAVESQANINVTNSAGPGAASLDASPFATGDATASGSFNALAPGATDSSDLSASLNASAAGLASGFVALDLTSDAGNNAKAALPSQTIEISGGVYRPATASVAPVVAAVGGPTSQALSITNTDPNDGFSENLIATVVGTTGGVTASGTTGDIAPQATSNAINLSFSTASPGTAAP
jgi:hypothetical protein